MGNRIGTPWRSYNQPLSPRARELASMIPEGYSNLEISRMMFISPRTVERYLGMVYEYYGFTGVGGGGGAVRGLK